MCIPFKVAILVSWLMKCTDGILDTRHMTQTLPSQPVASPSRPHLSVLMEEMRLWVAVSRCERRVAARELLSGLLCSWTNWAAEGERE